MSRSAKMLLVLAAVLGPASAQDDPLDGLGAFVEQARRDWNVPGASVAVVRGGKVVLVEGYGVRRLGSPEPVDRATLFPIGSTTKAFTSALIGTFVSEGRMTWDDPVVRHLPWFELHDPWVTRHVTIRDLLCHRTGLPAQLSTWLGIAFGYPRREQVERLRFLAPAHEFRSVWAYENTMFVAAGLAAASAGGAEWDDLLRDRVLLPLGMESTGSRDAVLRAAGNRVAGHAALDGGVQEVELVSLDDAGGPAGAMFSSAADMARWLLFQLSDGAVDGRRLVDPAVLAEMHRPQIEVLDPAERFEYADPPFLGYGLAWLVHDQAGHRVVRHYGKTLGTTSAVVLLPDLDAGLVVLANEFDAMGFHASVANRFIDACAGLPPTDRSAAERTRRERPAAALDPPRRVAGAPPSLPLAFYAGTYRSELWGDVRVALEGGNLSIALGPAGTRIDLDPWHFDSFVGTWRMAVPFMTFVTFGLSAEGRVERLQIQGLWGDLVRVPGPATSPAPAVDVHVHVPSPAVEALTEGALRSRSADHVLGMLDRAGARRGVLVSSAYLWAGEQVERARAENDWAASQAARDPARLVCLAGVDPIAPWALEELDRAIDELGMVGVKLHLVGSRVDLDDPEHVKRVGAVFARAQERDLPVLLHLGDHSSDALEPAAIDRLIDDVVLPHPGVRVLVAHASASNGGPRDRPSLERWLSRRAADPSLEARTWIDLSVVLRSYLDLPEETQRWIVERVREWGVDRALFGSDYPIMEAEDYLITLFKIPFTAEERGRILGNDGSGWLWGPRGPPR